MSKSLASHPKRLAGKSFRFLKDLHANPSGSLEGLASRLELLADKSFSLPKGLGGKSFRLLKDLHASPCGGLKDLLRTPEDLWASPCCALKDLLASFFAS